MHPHTAVLRRRDFLKNASLLAMGGVSLPHAFLNAADVNARAPGQFTQPGIDSLVVDPFQQGVPSTTSAHTAQLLIDDLTSLLVRLSLIERASSEVLLAAYEVGDDPVVLRMLAALRAAAWRGICVKLIVDGHAQNNLIPKPVMEYLICQGVQIREHMPDVRYQLELGRQRMHDKLLVVDGTDMLIGGRNLRADYYGMADDAMRATGRAEKNRLDRELHVAGPVVRHARSYFLARWNASTSGQPNLRREEKKKTMASQQLWFLNDMPRQSAMALAGELIDAAAVASLPTNYTDGHPRYCDTAAQATHQLACLRFIHDLPERPKDEPAAIANQLSETISRAQSCILIETPYLVMTKDLRRRLTEARQRNVAVCLLTNSLETTDQIIVHAQYANERRWLRAAGIQLWELKGERHLHAKAMLIDHHLAMVGSYNFDVLSETRNSEVALLIDDVPFANVLGRQMARHMLMSEPVMADEPLLGFDARTNAVEDEVLREARIKRLISPWIKRYL